MSAFQGEFQSCRVEMPRFNGVIHEVQNLKQTFIYNLQHKICTAWLGMSVRQEGIRVISLQ